MILIATFIFVSKHRFGYDFEFTLLLSFPLREEMALNTKIRMC